MAGGHGGGFQGGNNGGFQDGNVGGFQGQFQGDGRGFLSGQGTAGWNYGPPSNTLQGGASPNTLQGGAPPNFHGGAPPNFQGNVQGNFQGAAQGNVQGNFQGAAPQSIFQSAQQWNAFNNGNQQGQHQTGGGFASPNPINFMSAGGFPNQQNVGRGAGSAFGGNQFNGNQLAGIGADAFGNGFNPGYASRRGSRGGICQRGRGQDRG